MSLREQIFKAMKCPKCSKRLQTWKKCELCGWERDIIVIPKAVQQEVWGRDKGKCVVCGSKERVGYDYIIPYSKGGSSTAGNIQLLCETCNSNRYNRFFDYLQYNMRPDSVLL